MFSRVLIANRGEIACRVIRTARRLGVATIAVYSDADRGALHVAEADSARAIGPAPARESYLNIPALIAAARASGADAVHPGYGFLSENALFAEACAEAGLVFIGPPPAAMRAMGSKAASRALMEEHGVPLVPGYHGLDQTRLAEEAQRIGFPVLIKASSGGGGRGMRVVAAAGEFAAALEAAKREAAGAFGDERMLVEAYLDRPRHIEIQVFADSFGNFVHLFDRDCSIQRRHQKIVEEAPAPGLDPELRRKMAATALAAARAVSYVGAGTVEFIMAGGRFYFIEMNTRLQVEHAVTEAVTGLDLVEWQFRVAAGEALPLGQDEISCRGHAIEARLYAESPERGFLPATGTLQGLVLPGLEIARVDTGVAAGDAVSPFYDAMIAKIIVRGDDREAAVSRLGRALAATAVQGVATNLALLGRIARHPGFAAGAPDTGFIAREAEALLRVLPVPRAALAAAALHVLLACGEAAALSGDPHSPWALSDGWRLGARSPHALAFAAGASVLSLRATAEEGGWRLDIAGEDSDLSPGGRPWASAVRGPDGGLAVTLGAARFRARVLQHGAELAVFLDGESWILVEIDPLAPPAQALAAPGGRLSAPMPGRVAELRVAAGARVRAGEPLAILEAMKMEHTIAAPRDGVVAAISCAVGDLVEEGAELIALEEERPSQDKDKDAG